MKYTEKDITVGTKLRCTKARPSWWTVGKLYNVSLNDDGILQITDDNGHCAYPDYMVDCLNGKHNPVAFEIVEEEKEMKYTEKDLYEGMELLCIDNGGWSLWETGEIYTVTKSNLSGKLIIEGDDEVGRTFRDTEAILGYLNGEREMRLSTIEDQKEEEKEMTKYAKITKYAGLIDTDKENGLEIGKEYEIVKFSSVSEDCWVYLNDKRPEYFISETQYELVEKEVPKLKANVNVDVKEAIQDKIDELRTEAEHLFKKRDRLEQHGINLNKKAQKLKEVLETIKEFE
ncbi:tail length tape-measure protein [Enterococcus phage vB_EfaS_Ef6.1]|nr:tail length tape-measure protein [Enterococcus phage vB_EfaS_Ef6.1]